MRVVRVKQMAETRFWDKVDTIPDHPRGCWVWTGAKNLAGYGVMNKGQHKGNILAHRFSWGMANGEVSNPRVLVCHHCDNASCVRPDHLYLGDHKVNGADASARGLLDGRRHALGEAVNTARFTAADVIEMRRRFANGETKTEIARDFDTSDTNVHSIVTRQTWKHVSEEQQ